jgi:hypothetical protein
MTYLPLVPIKRAFKYINLVVVMYKAANHLTRVFLLFHWLEICPTPCAQDSFGPLAKVPYFQRLLFQ